MSPLGSAAFQSAAGRAEHEDALMAVHYLEFEKPIADLEAKIEELSLLSSTSGSFEAEIQGLTVSSRVSTADHLKLKSAWLAFLGFHIGKSYLDVGLRRGMELLFGGNKPHAAKTQNEPRSR